MIIFGTSKPQDVLAQTLEGTRCPRCQASNTIEALAYSRYAHIFWVAFFSIGKRTKAQCSHCGANFKTSKLPASYQERIKDMKAAVKIPFRHFTGLGLSLLLITVFTYQIKMDKADNLAFIQDPQAGDIYTAKEGNGYSLIKVSAVTEDSVALRYHEYVTDKLTGIGDLKKDTRFSPEVRMLSKPDLLDLFEEGEIRDVDR